MRSGIFVLFATISFQLLAGDENNPFLTPSERLQYVKSIAPKIEAPAPVACENPEIEALLLHKESIKDESLIIEGSQDTGSQKNMKFIAKLNNVEIYFDTEKNIYVRKVISGGTR